MAMPEQKMTFERPRISSEMIGFVCFSQDYLKTDLKGLVRFSCLEKKLKNRFVFYLFRGRLRSRGGSKYIAF